MCTSPLRLSHPLISGSRPSLDLRIRALFRLENTVQKSGYVANPLKHLFPRCGQIPCSWGTSLYGAVRSFGVHKPTFKAVAVTHNVSASSIAVVVNEDSQDATIPPEFTFTCRSDQEVTEGRNKRLIAMATIVGKLVCRLFRGGSVSFRLH